MRSAKFYAIAIFVIGWLLPRQGWCGSDGADCELARKGSPITSTP